MSVVIPFDKGGEWWHENGNHGVQVRNEIFDWLSSQGISYTRAFRSRVPFGLPHEIVFYFNQPSDATLFKLTWG